MENTKEEVIDYNKTKVKLLICYHKPDTLIKDEIFTPIHVGRALAKKRMKPDDPKLQWLLENMIGDDTGDNISDRNSSYNELTSLYWAWKNYDKLGNPDYIGLMHYRRHFVFNEGEIKVYNMPDMDSRHYFEFLNYSPEKLKKHLSECDFICHLGRVGGIYKHYLANHRIEDMELALEILDELHPEYSDYAKEYMKKDIGNFCNMFIFPREMFFEYCEFVFSILAEFEKRTDTSEKRFFVSERLTGIFIYKKMLDGLKYKFFPINFAEGKINIPIAYPVTENNLYAVTVSVISALKNAEKNTHFSFYFIGDNKEIDEKIMEKFCCITKKYNNCKFEFIASELEPEYYPLEISKKLPKINKIIYFNEKAIVMHDLAEFYRTCSVDDYYISGIPKTFAGNDSSKRELSGEIFVLNCARFRKYQIYENAFESISHRRPAIDIINELCSDQIGYFAEWFVTLAGSKERYNRTICSKTKNRGQLQLEATWRPVLYFGDNDPWENIQGLYSNFWWNYLTETPFLFPFPRCNELDVKELLNRQQQELNHIGSINRRNCSDDLAEIMKGLDYNILHVDYHNEEKITQDYWKYCNTENKFVNQKFNFTINGLVSDSDDENLSMSAKVKRYYKQFGLKRSVKRVFEKLSGK